MTLKNETCELELIAKSFQAISREISYLGLAKALLKAALDYSKVARGAVILSQRGILLSKADANFPREKTKIFASQPDARDFRLPQDLSERVLKRQEVIVRYGWKGFAPVDWVDCVLRQEIGVLCLPLVHQEKTIGILYLESEREEEAFTPGCISVMSLLASQAATSFESAQLFEALRETTMWMVKGQQIGRMGSYRWNTRTLLSRASRECHRIFDINPNVNPVPYEVFRSRIHPDDLPAFERSLAEVVGTKSSFSHEYRVVHKDGTTLHVVAVGQFDLGPSGDVELEGIITDVTEQKVSEQALTDARAELAQATRLASLGELAGSIVHEVNQPLTGILASAQACLRWLTREPAEVNEARKSAIRVVEQGLRATSVVSGLRSLVRDARLQVADVHLNETIKEVLLLLKRELERASVSLETNFDTTITNIEADRLQLQQVILNLVRNAIEAMADVNRDTRVLRVSSTVADGHVCVSIADTGVGIDPANREHLFAALYTTKGEGLGLGLSICRKIISAHGGRLWAEGNTTGGATLTFVLPLRGRLQRPRN